MARNEKLAKMSIMKEVIFIFLIFQSFCSLSQIDFDKHPSNWPDPFGMSMYERIDTGYTHIRVLDYLKWKQEWRMENLPKLYLFFDEEKERKLDRYQYGGGWNYELAYKISGNLVYYIQDRPTKMKPGYIKLISNDSLSKMDTRDGHWLREYFKENEITWTNRCWELTKICSELFIVIKNPDGDGYMVMKPNNCIEQFE